MWRLDNRTPYAARGTWLRDREGAEVWVVAVKATYDLLPDGRTRVAAAQAPVHSGPVSRPGGRELLYDTDLGPAKAATDVLLLGQAYAPGGQPVAELVVGFGLGPVQRQARVLGERGGEPGWLLNLTDPAFTPHGLLRFSLPRLSLGFETFFHDGHRAVSRSRIHTVILEPDAPRLSVVHHMTLPCHPRVNRLECTRIFEKRRPLDREGSS